MIAFQLPWLSRRAMALYPFVIFRKKSDRSDQVLVNHERIHLRQQAELLVLPFYALYVISYLYNLIGTLNHEQAYRKILFEQEAYAYQSDPGYLKVRRPFAFIQFL